MLDTLSRRKPLATYGRSQRKRKSAELFAEALDDISPRRPEKAESSSPEVEHIETPSHGTFKARKIDTTTTTTTNLQAVSNNSKTRAAATFSKATTRSFQTRNTSDDDHVVSLEETTISKTSLPVRSRFHDRNKNTKSTDVFDLLSSDEETTPKAKRSGLSKKFSVPSRTQPSTKSVNTLSQKSKDANTQLRQTSQTRKSTFNKGDNNTITNMKDNRQNSKLRGLEIGTRNMRSRSVTPPHDMTNDSRRTVAFDMSPERWVPKEKSRSRETLRLSPTKPILKPAQNAKITQTTSTTTVKRTNSSNLPHQRQAGTTTNVRPVGRGLKSQQIDLDEPMHDVNYGDNLEEVEEQFGTGILSDDLVNESMLIEEKTSRGNSRAGSLRSSNPSPSKRIESSLTDFLGDFVTTTEPPRKGRIKDALKAGVDHSPHSVLTVREEDVRVEPQIIPMQEELDKKTLSFSEDMEIIPNASQEAQVESQNSGANSQPRDHLLPTRTVKNTYLRTRSYLTEEMTGEDAFTTPLIPSPVKTQPAFDEGLDDDGPKKGGLRSMHELREAGGSKRFLDDMEGYMEDVESSELYRQRSAFMELANKMCDESSQDRAFVKKFRANNFDQRLLKDISTQNDEIIRFCIGYVLCIFLSEDTTGRTINQIRHNGAMPMLLDMLDSDRDILQVARDKATKMSKITQSLLADVRKKVISSSSFKDDKAVVLSSRLIALKVLEQVLQSVKHAGFDDDLVSAFEVNKFAHILAPYSDLKTPSQDLNLSMLQLPICVLEILSNGGNPNFHSQLSTFSLETVVKLLASVLRWQSLDEEMSEKIKDTQCLTLRLAINLTNHHKINSTTFATSSGLLALVVETTQRQFALLSNKEVHEDEEIHILQEVDILVLCLALIGSFAEFSMEARKMIVTEHVDKVTCIDALVTIFLDKIDEVANADSHEEAQANVAFGYLSVAIALFCEDSKIRKLVQARLPKKSLVPLCNAVEEFLTHHRSVDTQQQLQELADMHVTSSDAFTGRLEKVLEELKVYV